VTDRPDRRPIENGEELDLRARLFTRRTLLSVLLGAALLFLLFRVLLQLDPGEMLDLVLSADPLLLLGGFAAHYLTFPLRGWRWRYLLARADLPVNLRDAVEIFCLSWWVNLLAPARLGDVYRAYLLRSTYGAPLPRTFGTLLIERAADILGVFALAVAAGLWSFRGRLDDRTLALLAVGVGIALAVVGLIVLGVRARGWIARRLPRRAARLWDEVHDGAAAPLTPRGIGVVGAVTALIWILEGARLYLVVASLGLPEFGIGFSTAVFVALIGALFSILPLTPAGVGFVEGGVIYALTLYGVSTDAAATAAIVDRSITLVSVLALGSILYFVSRIARRGPTP
jgi:glycosyltransferase 2 family protein